MLVRNPLVQKRSSKWSIKRAKVKEHASEVIIGSSSYYYISKRWLLTESGGYKPDTVRNDDQKKSGKGDSTEGRAHSDSHGELSSVNTEGFNRRVVLMQAATVIATNGEDNYNGTKFSL